MGKLTSMIGPILWGSGSGGPAGDPVEFTPSELEKYTGGYKKTNLLGRGGFGGVYKGTIPWENERNLTDLKIAVKKSHNIVAGDSTITTQFEAEKEYLPRVEHQNIIKLVGYCVTEDVVFLVYPFMPNGNVNSKLSELDWSKTIKILKGVAKAIHKLHSHTPALIYRDLKPANILLDKGFNPKLADFGGVTVEGERLPFGTHGYTDPIVMSNGPGSKPNDVYSFGVVMLQLIMNEKKVLIRGGEWSYHITEWKTVERSRDGHVVNYKLMKSCSKEDAKEITNLAFNCVGKDPKLRPTISQVLNRLSFIS